MNCAAICCPISYDVSTFISTGAILPLIMLHNGMSCVTKGFTCLLSSSEILAWSVASSSLRCPPSSLCGAV